MPYKSEKQRKYMHVKHPEIAAKFDKEGKGYVKGKAAKKAASSKKAGKKK